MEISIIPVGILETNCSIIFDKETKLCAVVDPGDETENLLAAMARLDLTCKAIFLTHGHHDHVRGVRALHEATGAPVYIHHLDLTLPEKLTAGPLFFTNHYADGDQISVGNLTFSVLHTPGHTAGSVCLLCEDVMLAGDTLFYRSCGRVDLPGGSWDDMRASLKRLAALDGDYTVYPGHGAHTILSQERSHNPYMTEVRQ